MKRNSKKQKGYSNECLNTTKEEDTTNNDDDNCSVVQWIDIDMMLASVIR